MCEAQNDQRPCASRYQCAATPGAPLGAVSLLWCVRGHGYPTLRLSMSGERADSAVNSMYQTLQSVVPYKLLPGWRPSLLVLQVCLEAAGTQIEDASGMW